MPTYHVISRSKTSLAAEPSSGVRGMTLDGPTPEVVRRAAEILSDRPGLRVQVVGVGPDLDFLADLPPLVDLTVMRSDNLADVGGLVVHAHSLRHLTLEKGNCGLDISAVAELAALEQLYLRSRSDRPLRNVEPTLTQLSDLRHLTLHSVTLHDAHSLTRLRQLQGLAFKLGGNRDLTFLPRMPRLRFLEIWRTRMLEDLGPLGDCSELQALYLSQLSRASVPPLSGATSLLELHADEMPRLDGLRNIAAAPQLRYLSVRNCRLTPHDVRHLADHPSLRAASLPLSPQPNGAKTLTRSSVSHPFHGRHCCGSSAPASWRCPIGNREAAGNIGCVHGTS